MSDFLKSVIRDIPDFPKKGIIFKDISTLLQNKKAYKETIDNLYDYYKNRNIDYIAGIDARGFIFGGALADRLGVGFLPVRKIGKLPYKTISAKYELEYGFNEICIHEDACKAGDNVVIIDDLLATGGTAMATCELIEKLGANVASIGFVIELMFLNGREKLNKYDVYSIVKY